MTKNEAVRAAWKAADAADEYRAPFEEHFLAALGANGYDVVSITERGDANYDTIDALRTENARLLEVLKQIDQKATTICMDAELKPPQVVHTADADYYINVESVVQIYKCARAAMGESDE